MGRSGYLFIIIISPDCASPRPRHRGGLSPRPPSGAPSRSCPPPAIDPTDYCAAPGPDVPASRYHPGWTDWTTLPLVCAPPMILHTRRPPASSDSAPQNSPTRPVRPRQQTVHAHLMTHSSWANGPIKTEPPATPCRAGAPIKILNVRASVQRSCALFSTALVIAGQR
jgi:hypothetical protein